MVISHNLTALNAQRQFNLVNTSRAKSTEKLSSGYKINRAADDAAGLAISEKLRRQIRGLSQASSNCKEGIGLCQVKDGALTEVHDVLQRMNELSVKAANGTLDSIDRSYIQSEVEQLVSEVDRISRTTTFNEIYIFDYDNPMKFKSTQGSYSKTSALGTGYMTDSYLDTDGKYYPSANLDFGVITPSNVSQLYDKSFSFNCGLGCHEAFKFTFANGGGSSGTNLTGTVTHEYVIDIGGATTGKEVLDRLFSYVLANPSRQNSSDNISGNTINSMKVSHSNRMIRTSDSSLSIATVGYGQSTKEAAEKFYADNVGTGTHVAKADFSELVGVFTDETVKNVLPIQAGAEASQYIYLTMDKMNSTVLGIKDLSVITQDNAGACINKIKYALSEISRMRSDAGAEQNRLEHAINNLDNVVENTTSAESLIRDTDMASEMVTYSLKNILAQAGQAMMAQANQSNQGVLSLLG